MKNRQGVDGQTCDTCDKRPTSWPCSRVPTAEMKFLQRSFALINRTWEVSRTDFVCPPIFGFYGLFASLSSAPILEPYPSVHTAWNKRRSRFVSTTGAVSWRRLLMKRRMPDGSIRMLFRGITSRHLIGTLWRNVSMMLVRYHQERLWGKAQIFNKGYPVSCTDWYQIYTTRITFQLTQSTRSEDRLVFFKGLHQFQV
jgi:hypothetical protein